MNPFNHGERQRRVRRELCLTVMVTPLLLTMTGMSSSYTILDPHNLSPLSLFISSESSQPTAGLSQTDSDLSSLQRISLSEKSLLNTPPPSTHMYQCTRSPSVTTSSSPQIVFELHGPHSWPPWPSPSSWSPWPPPAADWRPWWGWGPRRWGGRWRRGRGGRSPGDSCLPGRRRGSPPASWSGPSPRECGRRKALRDMLGERRAERPGLELSDFSPDNVIITSLNLPLPWLESNVWRETFGSSSDLFFLSLLNLEKERSSMRWFIAKDDIPSPGDWPHSRTSPHPSTQLTGTARLTAWILITAWRLLLHSVQLSC